MPDALIDAPAHPAMVMAWTSQGFREGPVSLWIHKGGGLYRDETNLTEATLPAIRHVYGEDRVRPVQFCDAD